MVERELARDRDRLEQPHVGEALEHLRVSVNPLPPKVCSARSAASRPASQAATFAMFDSRPGLLAGVVQPARPVEQQPRALDADQRLGERMLDRLVRSDRHVEDDPLAARTRSPCARHQRPIPTACAATISRSGFSPSNSARPPPPGAPIIVSSGRTQSKKTAPLVLERGRVDADAASTRRPRAAGRTRRATGRRSPRLARRAIIASDDSSAEMKVFSPRMRQPPSRALGASLEVPRVRARVGLGEREAEPSRRPRRHPEASWRCCSSVAATREDRAGDRRRDHELRGRVAARGEPLGGR